jgi:hypothetical protein
MTQVIPWLTDQVASLLPAATASANFHSCQSVECSPGGIMGTHFTSTLYSCQYYSSGGGTECHQISCCGTVL